MWRTIIDTALQAQKTAIRSVENTLENVGLLGVHTESIDDDRTDYEEDDSVSVLSLDSCNIVNCGYLCEGRRLDYMLQEREIENANEYLFSLVAHSSYWRERDLSFFLARRIIRSSISESINHSISV